MASVQFCSHSGLVFLLVFVNCVYSVSVPHGEIYYMTEMCGGEVDMVAGNLTWGRLRLNRKQSTYANSMDCWVHIRAPARRSVMVHLLRMHIPQVNDCDDDFVQIFDDSKELSSKLCGDTAPDMHFHATSRNISVHMRSETVDEHRDFQLMFTAFHTGPCEESEFTCNNGHCIDGTLYCNHFNNCGDSSDECVDHVVTIVVVLVVIVVVLVVFVVVMFFLRRRVRRKRGLRKTNTSKLEFERVNQEDNEEGQDKETKSEAANVA